MTINEARKILGKKHVGMTDEEVEKMIDTLDVLAAHALDLARKERMKDDASNIAELIYDIHKDKKRASEND